MISDYKKFFAEILTKELTNLLKSSSNHLESPSESSEISSLIEIPPENIPGDLAFPCFQLSKTLKKSPNIIAQELTTKFTDFTHFTQFTAIGGYLNAHINPSNFITNFFNGTGNLELGTGNSKTKVLLEYMSANPNKPLHIGHIRNVCIGDSLRRIFKYLGYNITASTYGDDSGVNVGYNIVGHLFYNYPLTSNQKFDHYCGKIYEEMNKKAIKNSENEMDPTLKKQLSETLAKIENGNPEIYKLHQDYTQKCATAQLETCRRANASFDLINRETDILHLKFFAEAMDLLKDKGHVKFADKGEAQGCRIIDLSSLPEYAKEEKQYHILIKSDGIATYVAKDIAFAMRKLGYLNKDFSYKTFVQEPNGNIIYTTTSQKTKSPKTSDSEVAHGKIKFGNYNIAITIIDNRQLHPQEVVKSSLKLLGYLNETKKYLPLGYGIVYLTPQTLIKLGYKLSDKEQSEKRLPFASRKGRTVNVDETLQMLHEKAYQETKERNPEKDDTRLDTTAEKIAVSSLRFFLIKSDITKDIVFDIDESLDMQGESGAYVLYTGARIQSIIDSAPSIPTIKSVNLSNLSSLLTSPFEFDLVKKLSEFDSIILQTKNNLAPHLICRYLLELSTLTNSYYAHIKVLVDEEEIKNARIFLLTQILETLKKTMTLIGMEFLERM